MYLLVLFLPFINAFFLGFFGRLIGTTGSGILSTICMGSSTLIAFFLAYEVLVNDAVVHIELYKWIESEIFITHVGLLFDTLSVTMLLVISSISTLVHIYSTSYMSEDPHVPRFICYLSLFTFLMMVLVTSDNYLQLFIGWEGVGVCSYLLVAFWTTRIQANKAAIKAIVVNRVGDVGVILGMVLIYKTIGSLDFLTFNGGSIGSGIMDRGYSGGGPYESPQAPFAIIGILLLIGCIGKSAQLGLHTWLPDAMEGPTPVSALIHAATMVTAGVFLMIRSFPLFEKAPFTLLIITIFGALTAFFAATVGLVQNDLKKVIAYSTCSQLGYMVLIIGIEGSQNVGLFHLVNHAFFKALLFLSAGSVIHSMTIDEQDMRKMGGLIHSIPFTYTMMLIGSFSIMGLPYLTGFYSKDLILELTYFCKNMAIPYRGSIGSPELYIQKDLGDPYPVQAYGLGPFRASAFAFWLGTVAALLTAFYSIRLVYITFIITPNSPKESLISSHINIVDKRVLTVLSLLCFGAIFVGYLIQDILIGDIEHPIVPPFVKVMPTFMGLFGMGLCLWAQRASSLLPLYRGNPLGSSFLFSIYSFLSGAWQGDHLINKLVAIPLFSFGHWGIYKTLDRGWLELFGPQGISTIALRVSQFISNLQSGVISRYALVFLSFTIIFLALGAG
uniref:NADH-ubiquinone oxidoreductase chain 5 n=1 Tax=Hoilungia sp. H23 TaxID=2781605 RepID=A0A7U3RTX8_9METZ|nr:NADH dehydrogenase subunit 5 [Hoilungia sp. H23]